MKRAAIAADQAAVLATPVDTGRARGNWVVSIGVPRYGEPNTPPAARGRGRERRTAAGNQSANKALKDGRSTVLGYKLGKGGIFITNSVPYIGLLENGSSAQAPNGMTAAALSAAARQLGNARLLDGV